MAPPKKRGSTTKKGTTRLLDLPPVGKVPDPKAGRWDAKGVKLSDDLLRKKNRERARKAALTKRKKAQDLKKSLGQVYKDVEEMMEAPVKAKRPLAGAALKAQQDKIKREAEKAAKEEEARLQREITEQAEREIREQLDQEKAERDRYLKLRDAKREARGKITKTLTAMRQRKAGIAQQGAAQAEQQVEADQDDDLDEVEQAASEAVPSTPRGAFGSARNFFRAARHAYDNPRWVKQNQPNQSPTGMPKKGFYYDEFGDLWRDGQKLTGKGKTTKSKAATEYESAKQDALNKPTGNPAARAEDVAKWKAATGTDVMSIRTQTGKKAMFQVNMVDRQGKPMDVVFEREVTELEKLSGLQKAQDKWEKEEQRKKDAKESKHTVDNFRLKDYIKAPQMMKDAAHAFIKPAQNMLGELKNVVEGILGVAGIFAALYGLKKVADNAVPIINGIVDSVLAVEEGFYRMTFQSDKADEIKKRREQNRNSMDAGDQKTADTTSKIAGVAGAGLAGYGALWAGSKALRLGKGIASLGRGIFGAGEAASAAGATEGAAGSAGLAAISTTGLAATAGAVGLLYSPAAGGSRRADGSYTDDAGGDRTNRNAYKSNAELWKIAHSKDVGAAHAAALQLFNRTTVGTNLSSEDLEAGIKAIQASPDSKAMDLGIDLSAPAPAAAPTTGVRYNNPGNLRVPGSSEFRKFGTLSEGLKAQSDQLGMYYNGTSAAAGHKKLTTVADIINKWAPPSDNNPTDVYIDNVSRALNVKPNDPIDLSDPEIRIKMMQAMNKQEGMLQKPLDPSVYREALSGGSVGLDMSRMRGQVDRGTVPVQQMQDPNLLRQQVAAQQAANNSPMMQPTAQVMPAPSNWQQRPGLHSDYIDNVPMLVMNGGALAS